MIFLKRTILSMNETLTGTTSPGQSGTGSNSNEEILYHFSDFQNWSLTHKVKKWYLIPPCLTLSNIRYLSRVKWSLSPDK